MTREDFRWFKRKRLCYACGKRAKVPARPGRTTCEMHGGDPHRKKSCACCGGTGHNIRTCKLASEMAADGRL